MAICRRLGAEERSWVGRYVVEGTVVSTGGYLGRLRGWTAVTVATVAAAAPPPPPEC